MNVLMCADGAVNTFLKLILNLETEAFEFLLLLACTMDQNPLCTF